MIWPHLFLASLKPFAFTEIQTADAFYYIFIVNSQVWAEIIRRVVFPRGYRQMLIPWCVSPSGGSEVSLFTLHHFVDILNDRLYKSLFCCQDMGSTFLFKTVPMETRHRMHLKMFLMQNWWKIRSIGPSSKRVYFAVMTSGLYTYSLNTHGLCFYRPSQTWTLSPVMCTHVVPSGLV